MIKHRMVKIGFIAVALVAGAGIARTSTLEASGYIVASSLTGETSCQPGGAEDCGGSSQLI